MGGVALLDRLNERFGIAGVARFEAGPGGLARITVTASSAEGQLYLHGAHVTHYRPAGQAPLLFLSSRSSFVSDTAIRGGVPVIFPWFGRKAGDPSAPDHGVARTAAWAIESVERDGDGAVAVTLALDANAGTRSAWPHEFGLRYRAVFGARLELTLEVENRSSEAFLFEEALHTYLMVGDVGEATVSGLEGTTYIDKVDGMARKVLGAEPWRLRERTDRVFLETGAVCSVVDSVLARRLTLDKHGSATTVVWNPWAELAMTMADLGPDEWRSMLCVETANAADNAVTLTSGGRHSMGVSIHATPV